MRGAEPEAACPRVDGRRIDAGSAHERLQPRLLRARERAQAGDRERAVLVDERHDVGDRRERDEVEVPLRDLRVDAEERLAELVDDAGAAELRETDSRTAASRRSGSRAASSPGRWWSVTITSSPRAFASATSATAVMPQSTVITRP